MLGDEDVRVLLRSAAGWKGAKALAIRLGISQSYLSEIMNGKKAANDLVLSGIGLKRTIVRVSQKDRLQSIPESVG